MARARWAIENALHWQLDVSFREDGGPENLGRNRKDSGPANIANLRRLHEGYALRRVAGRQRIHDLAQIGRPRRAILSRLGRSPRRQFAVLICPFRHRQVRVGPHAPAPAAQDILGPIKAEVEVSGQIAIINRG